MFLISPAFAQATADATAAVDPAAAGGANSILTTFAPLILVFFVFYVMVIRPQNKRMQEQRATLGALKKGDTVITGGGLVAIVKKVSENTDDITIEIAPGVEVTAVRSTIMSVRK